MHRTISSWQCQFLPRVVAAAKNTTMAALAATLLRRPPEPPQIFKHWHGDRRGTATPAAPGQGQSITGPSRQVKTLVRTSPDSCRGTAGERPLTLALIMSLRLGAV